MTAATFVDVEDDMAAIAEDAVLEHLLLAGQYRAGRAERSDGAVGETDDDRVGEVDGELERLGQRGDAGRPRPVSRKRSAALWVTWVCPCPPPAISGSA